MLTPEQAQLHLKASQISDVEQWRLKAIATLPDEPLNEDIRQTFIKAMTQKQPIPDAISLRGMAYGLISRNIDGTSIEYTLRNGYELRRDVVNGSQNAMLLLTSDERLQLFKTFFPKVAVYIEQLWQYLPTLPYQSGYTRQAFRAPGHSERYDHLRVYLFHRFLGDVGLYNENILWFAEHAAYIGYGHTADTLGRLFAAVIDAGGETADAVFDVLLASARGEHETGAMGRHVTRALLTANRSDGWTFMEKLLLAAQREEGLRQVILETVDEAHPEAFRRLLHVILDNDLSRFSAVTRALNVWFGYAWDSESTRVINNTIQQILTLIESDEARLAAIQKGGGEALYLGLWTVAVKDAYAAIDAAVPLLNDPDVERRFAATQLLIDLNLSEARIALLPALADPDLRVAVSVCHSLYTPPAGMGVFEMIEALLARLPKSHDLPSQTPIVWPWKAIQISAESIVRILLNALEDRSPKRMLPYFDRMNAYTRVEVIKKLVDYDINDPEIRDLVFKSLAERDQHTRNTILHILEKQTVRPQENVYLESLLTRKSGELRRGLMSLLCRQEDADVLISADRLIASGKVDQRQGGWEILQMMHHANRSAQACIDRACAYLQTRPKLTQIEQNLLESIVQPLEDKPTLANALGLMDPVGRTKPIPPVKREVQIVTEATVANLLALDEFIHEHRHASFIVDLGNGTSREILLANAHYSFPETDVRQPIQTDVQRLPLREFWEDWVEKRPPELLDDDGLEWVRMRLLLQRYGNEQNWPIFWKTFRPDEKIAPKFRYERVLEAVVRWMMRLYPAPNTADFILDCIETTWTGLSEEYILGVNGKSRFIVHAWVTSARSYHLDVDGDWQDQHYLRLWNLVHWMDEPFKGVLRYRPEFQEVLIAHKLGAASIDDIYDQLLGPEHYSFGEIQMLSGRKPSELFEKYPFVVEIFERCRQRILEVELSRADMPTEATGAAAALRSVPGIPWFIRILQALGKQDISRERGGQSRIQSLSHLLYVSYPTVDETLADFTKASKKSGIPVERFIEAAVYAPQWAPFIEQHFKWKGLVDAVWWLRAHTKDSQWSVPVDVRDEWAASINARTPLSPRDLLEGAVDVDWFWRVYKALGDTRWQTVYDAAKYSSSGIGHGRAKQFADAMLGNLEPDALFKRITDKRHQDSIRALGLLPLPKRKRDDEILKRYKTLQQFLRGSRKFGPQRRESEKLAVQIAMENLARTADYPDPARLGWAMEAREVADLRSGSIHETVEDVTLTLSLDVVGKPKLTVEHAGKIIKALPTKMKKQPDFIALRERKTQLDQQHSRMRLALENAMCREDQFVGKELVTLMEHPILAPMLEQLIFIGEDLLGYPVEGGRRLISHDSSTTPIPASASLRIAHAYDLFQSNEWHLWQRDCFLAERIQPFKQVFRELYPLTETERAEGNVSRRYAGHQVQPRQAIALLGTRGWIAHQDYGVQKTFHRQNLSVHVSFLGGYFTPAEVEGLTIEGVYFTLADAWKPIPLQELPPILFSEVMRDMDLVVSVAHRGGIDPETTASTVEMRTMLLRETFTLLKINNVELQGNYALVEGKLGSYSVHLGSAVVHRQPGGSLCIIPVHAQHRGRIFLPFADDDPKTAEVISKTLLLARDAEIKDPSILEQIFAKG